MPSIISTSPPRIRPHHRECLLPPELSLGLKPRPTPGADISGDGGQVIDHLLALEDLLNLPGNRHKPYLASSSHLNP